MLLHAVKFFVAVALYLTAPMAQAAGFRLIEVPADADGPALKGAMWHPCADPPGEITLGPYILSVAKDCPISGDRLLLVVISHGNGGTELHLYDTAEALADAGFVVAAIKHPGDTTFDVSRFLSALVERPTDIRRLIDFMLGASPAASRIDPERIGFFGFSLAAIPASPSSAPTLIGPPPPNIASNGITRSRAASRYAGGNSRRSPLSTTRGSRPPCSPNRSAFSFPPTAWWALKRRSSYGHPNMAAGVDARKHRRCGPEPAGKARIPRRTQCRALCFRPLSAGIREGGARVLQRRAGLRPRPVPQPFNADMLAFFRAHLVDR